MQNNKKQQAEPGRSFRAAVLIGIGVMVAVDEIVFHQLLAWHHFYDRATTELALLSDGLLHAAELMAIVAGFFMLVDLKRSHTFVPVQAWAGFFIGAGGFQLFDGIIDHKVLRVHQVRYDVEIFPYDLAWNLAGIVLLLIGLYLRLKAQAAVQSASSSAAKSHKK